MLMYSTSYLKIEYKLEIHIHMIPTAKISSLKQNMYLSF